MQATKIDITATIAVDRSKVWAYYTQPEHITKWNYANDDWHCPHAENDLRVGGKYKARMEAKDKSFGFDFEAIYDEVKDQSRIAYTMGDGRQAITTFETEGKATKVKTTFDAEGENSLELQRDGWQAILNNFKRYVESN